MFQVTGALHGPLGLQRSCTASPRGGPGSIQFALQIPHTWDTTARGAAPLNRCACTQQIPQFTELAV